MTLALTLWLGTDCVWISFSFLSFSVWRKPRITFPFQAFFHVSIQKRIGMALSLLVVKIKWCSILILDICIFVSFQLSLWIEIPFQSYFFVYFLNLYLFTSHSDSQYSEFRVLSHIGLTLDVSYIISCLYLYGNSIHSSPEKTNPKKHAIYKPKWSFPFLNWIFPFPFSTRQHNKKERHT